MLVTFTNATSAPLMVQSLYVQIPLGGSVTTRRSWSDLDMDFGLKRLVATNQVTLSFTKETGDDAAIGFMPSMQSYDDTSRPDASTVPIFTVFWNTADNAANWSDGTNWRDAMGHLT